MTIRGHLHVVPEPGLEKARADLWEELRSLYGGLGVLMLNLESERDPQKLYDGHRAGERLGTAVSIVHDELAKLSESEEQ